MNGATGVFQGKILVKPGAQKTDGYQISQSLLLDEDSQFLAKPELEIYADDVKCSHGSTSGAIDETALFYLQSRGVPRRIARRRCWFWPFLPRRSRRSPTRTSPKTSACGWSAGLPGMDQRDDCLDRPCRDLVAPAHDPAPASRSRGVGTFCPVVSACFPGTCLHRPMARRGAGGLPGRGTVGVAAYSGPGACGLGHDPDLVWACRPWPCGCTCDGGAGARGTLRALHSSGPWQPSGH
jgi:hypothetical protein